MMLRSNADWSWICKDGEKHINWLRDPDMLPAQVPRARIIVYRYESTWHVDAPQTRLQLCGEELVHSLHAFRAGRPSRPLVLVGHSLGGNVIVQAFLYANDDSKYEPLVKTTVGLVFLGTPFRGSKWQPLADALAQLMRPAGSHRGIMRELGFDEPALRDSVQRFCKLCNKLSTVVACFSELRETDFGRRLGIVGVAKGMIVEETSACIPGFDRYALEKDHLRINKYYGPTDPAFERVSNAIAEMCHRANDVVRRRFERRELITDNHVALEYNPAAGGCLHDLFVTDPLEDKKALKRKKGNRAAGTSTSVVRGLLLQLIQQHPPLLRHVLQKYNERKAKLFESFDALWAIFIKAAADKNTGRKYFIIDALDECEVDSQKTLLHQLRDTFHSPDAPSNVQILVTSRPYPEIRKYLGSFTCMDFACFPDTKRDIDQCIKKRVAQLPKYTEKIKERVTDILRYKAAGTFLWVGIACNELEDIPSKDAISFLEAMPSGLHALYERLFSAALEKEREKDTIRLILGFVAVSQRPLTLLELSGACRLRQDEDDVETRTQFMRDELQVHADLAYRCLDYLIEQFHNKKQNAGHFWDYATREWPDHAHLAQSKFVVMASQAEFFKIISPCRESWLAAYHGFGKSSGTAELAALLPEKDDNDTWANNEGRTPLHWASENGHVGVVKLFLAYKTHPLSVISGASKITADVDRMTALHYTVSNTSEEMAQYLLDAGVSINTGVARRDWSRSKLEIKARCIPDAGSDSVVHCSIHCGLTALHYAALTGCKKMTEYLLAQGANPNARSVYDETPLHLALKRDLYGPSWHDAPDRWNDPAYRIEGALDNIGYNANDEHEYGVTRDLIEQHRLAVLTLLLNKGSTDVNAKDKYGASSLHCVNYENDNAPDIIRLLIERGADISARNNQGQTALHLACSTESLCSVTALVKQGADIAAVDFESLNAVHYAAQSGNTRLVQIMAQEWPATLVAARDKRGRNALHHLVKESYHADEEAIVSLVSAGVRVEDLDDEGSSPLSLYLTADLPLSPNAARVSWESRIEVLQTLEEFGVDVAAKDCEGRTLLHHCAIAGSLTEQAFHFLRDKAGLDKHLQDHHGKTPLQYATEERRKERDPFIYDPNRWSRTERILLGVPEYP
ncbi:hypothetical protein ARSEF4850_002521 [Beauveria asiatica]